MTISTPREALEAAAQCVEASRLAGGRSSLEAFKATKKEIAAVIRAIPVAEPGPTATPDPLTARLVEQLDERAKLIVELLAMIRFGNQGFAGGVHIQRARRIIDGLPEAIAEGEANYRAYCLASPDHVHEGTLEELATCARMLDEYGVKEMPANENGQIEFNRAMMESTVGAINAFLAAAEGRG